MIQAVVFIIKNYIFNGERSALYQKLIKSELIVIRAISKLKDILLPLEDWNEK